MTLATGSRLGSYEITAKLGEGGMGEVWRARDTRLERDVAIKVLPAAFVEDHERLARFEREAKLLAQLNHPNIAHIYGMEASGESHALVMELVEGPTLAERLEAGPLPFQESLSISLQIAQALEEAHEKGIVHRDLKPQNIKASIDGKVKVLDFGLAKAMDPTAAASGAGSASQLAASPTLTLGATQMGVILGTAAYMAPEQAKGLAVDKRADIWAFGVVLFEMLAGRRLFDGDSVPETLAGVLKTDVDFAMLPESTPPAIRRLLRRCLERSPKNRLHDIADARIVLEDVRAGRGDEAAGTASAPAGGAIAPPRRARWALAAAALGVGLALGALLAAGWAARRAAGRAAPAASRFVVLAPPKTAIIGGLALSPDGRQLAFAARGEDGRTTLWIRPLDQLEAHELAGTSDARYPFWAPDSRRLGFFAERKLKWIDLLGGTPLEIAATSSVQDVRGAAWGAGDVIVFAPTFVGPLMSVAVRGGSVTPATRLPASGEFGTQRFPSMLPDGKRFVFYASSGSGTEPGSLFLGRLGSLETKLLGPSFSTAIYAEPGFLIFARGETLVAQRFDDEREELVGDPVPLGLPAGGSISISGLRSFSVSRDGTLISRLDGRNATRIVWTDRRGRELDEVSDGSSTWSYAPRLSPDGRRLVVGQYQGGSKQGELWVHDLARKVASRLTFTKGGDDYLTTWLRPDGREILFQSNRPGSSGGIYRIDPDRPGEERPWWTDERTPTPSASTPDGKRLIVEQPDATGKIGLWIRDVDGKSEATPIGQSSASESNADLSPDGRWLAYTSDATRTPEVYARRLDGVGGALRISRDGGSQPLWSRDGRELFYLDAVGRLVAVPIRGGERLEPGAPEVLFNARLEEASDRQYDVSADGQRFLLNRSVVSDDTPIVVTLHWSALVQREPR